MVHDELDHGLRGIEDRDYGRVDGRPDRDLGPDPENVHAPWLPAQHSRGDSVTPHALNRHRVSPASARKQSPANHQMRRSSPMSRRYTTLISLPAARATVSHPFALSYATWLRRQPHMRCGFMNCSSTRPRSGNAS